MESNAPNSRYWRMSAFSMKRSLDLAVFEWLLPSESNGMDSSSSQRHLCAKLELLSTSEQKEGVHHE
jgi:hypothetical protein